ncbi:MAG: energy-coupling factor ABC transporter permease [Acidobacteriota bacterium]
MHIPDGFLNLPVLLSTGAISGAFLIPSVNKINRESTPDRIPLMGLSAAFVFAAQILSFPVFGGTSAHISGAVLISILLGPMSGFLITAAAVILQALLFQHGGVLTLGANILNIAILQSFLGYYIFRIFSRKFYSAGIIIATFIALILGATICAFELILSGTIPLKEGLIAMISSHIITGFIESGVTLLIIGMIKKLTPKLLELKKI